MRNVFIELWQDAETPLDYVVLFWVAGLAATAIVGVVGLVYGILSGQADVNNATFGIFDTLG